MPSYKTHLVAGALAGGAVLYVTGFYHCSLVTTAELICAALLGSLFPDIDTKSKGQQLFYRLFVIFLFCFLIQQRYRAFFILAFLGTIPLLVRHRGMFHHPWFILVGLLFGIIGAHMNWPSYARALSWDLVFFGVGALSHIVLDIGLVNFFRRLVP